MGTDLKLAELRRKKEAILSEMVKNVEDWDRRWESGVKLINRNEEMIEKLKALNDELKPLKNHFSNSNQEEEQLRLVAERLEEIIQEIYRQKEEILREKKKLQKHENLESHYLKKRGESQFIDKII
jgi:DNA repair exonuclease SbcCD ATPase subunit